MPQHTSDQSKVARLSRTVACNVIVNSTVIRRKIMALDYKKMAAEIVEKSGGVENIKTVAHCATRLRFTLVNKDIVDMEGIQKIKGVLGCIYATDQLQIILGKDLPPVYDIVVKDYPLQSASAGSGREPDGSKKQPLSVKSVGDAIVGFVAGAVAPLVPGLIAGGMLKVFLLLITYAMPAFAETNAYLILGWVANAPFYFMPIFVAYGASTKLGATPVYAMAGVASLLTPAFTQMVTDGTPLTMFNIPVRLVKYPQQLLPALLIALAAAYIEKLLNKIVPGIFKSIFVGMGTMALSMTLGFTVLGPLGGYIGSAISGIFVWLGGNVGPVAVAALAACLPWLVMMGMHHAITPFMAQSIADPGYDPIFRPAYILHNMSEGGACLGVGLRTKNKEFRSECLSLAFGCIVAGVTEPAIYGVNFRLKRPMLGVMAGGAVGGIVTGLLGAKAYAMGYSTVMALPIFQDTILAMATGIVVAIATAAAVTFVLGFEDVDSEEEPAMIDSNSYAADDTLDVVAIADGSMIDITKVNDETFAQKMLGDGVAFELADGIVGSPCDGMVTMLADTGHAFAVSRKDGVQFLVHIGIDTVQMSGKGFKLLVKEGQHVKAGQPVVETDLAMLRGKGYDMTTMLIIADPDDKEVNLKLAGKVAKGDIIGK